MRSFDLFMEQTDITAAVTRHVFDHFNGNFASRAKEGKGYTISAQIATGKISIQQYFTHKVYQTYDVHEAVMSGKDSAQIIEEINSIIDMLAADPKTPPNDAQMDKEIGDYYSAKRGLPQSH